MRVLVNFDGREAIPIRAIPLLTDWTRMRPDQIAAALAWDLTHHWQFQGLTAFRIEDGTMRSIPNTWWNSFPRRELKALQDRISSNQISHETGYQEWREQSLIALPAGVFVWRDEYEPMYYRTVGPSSRIFNVDTGDGVPDPGLLPYVQLQFAPFIPDAETQRIVMDGFAGASSERFRGPSGSIASSPRTESKEGRQDRRLGLCEAAGLTMDSRALQRLPDGVGDVADREGVCQRRLNIDPPCRSNIDPGRVAGF